MDALGKAVLAGPLVAASSAAVAAGSAVADPKFAKAENPTNPAVGGGREVLQNTILEWVDDEMDKHAE